MSRGCYPYRTRLVGQITVGRFNLPDPAGGSKHPIGSTRVWRGHRAPADHRTYRCGDRPLSLIWFPPRKNEALRWWLNSDAGWIHLHGAYRRSETAAREHVLMAIAALPPPSFGAMAFHEQHPDSISGNERRMCHG